MTTSDAETDVKFIILNFIHFYFIYKLLQVYLCTLPHNREPTRVKHIRLLGRIYNVVPPVFEDSLLNGRKG